MHDSHCVTHGCPHGAYPTGRCAGSEHHGRGAIFLVRHNGPICRGEPDSFFLADSFKTPVVHNDTYLRIHSFRSPCVVAPVPAGLSVNISQDRNHILLAIGIAVVRPDLQMTSISSVYPWRGTDSPRFSIPISVYHDSVWSVVRVPRYYRDGNHSQDGWE